LGWVYIQGVAFGDPFWRILQSQSKSGFSYRKTRIFVFITTLTKQILFGHSENKNHPPDGG
jgi:hypothetical protein